ncbi:MAG: sigma-70 family RNA polymerase sigma factor [Bacteroidetes bacterium]|nr:sigma-70 family RNA polymerase sigma factor [Bacteroidota bacterium]
MELKTKYSEQELVTLLQQRSNAAYNYLYDNYSAALFSIINQIIPDRDTASDVLQEVFVNIWKKIELYDMTKGRLFTWMLNIARNASIDKVRSRGYQESMKNRVLPEDNDIHIGGSISPKVDDVGLKKVVMKLKEEHRLLIDLSYFQGFTHEEISKALNIPLGTVKTRIRSALIQLRTMIQ